MEIEKLKFWLKCTFISMKFHECGLGERIKKLFHLDVEVVYAKLK